MPNGSRCHSPALRGLNFCYYHNRLHLLASPARTVPADGSAAVLVPEVSESFHLPVLEDRSAIQVALSQILDALASNRLDPRRASVLLYGLQVATQNVERKQDILPFNAVESVTHTRDGHELAPEIRVCESSDHCSTCPHRDDCENFQLEEIESEV